MIMQAKFKVGDKVRCVQEYLKHLTFNQVYTVRRVHGGRYYIDTDLGGVGVYSDYVFELVEPNPVLTPEEVFEHLLKGTKLQVFREPDNLWATCEFPENVRLGVIMNSKWRIKPEPEVIELNGKRYKLIEE